MVGGMTQGVDCLPSKCEGLSSNPCTKKRKEKKKESMKTFNQIKSI
jgi:hypothetical protein